MTKADIQTALKGFIVRELLDGKDSGLDAHAPLLEWGIIDSMSVVRLVTFIQDEFAVAVPDTEITSSSFGTVESLSEMVLRLKGAAGAAGQR